MTRNVPRNATNESAEQAKKANPSLTTQAIREFIESKLLGPDGGGNFNEIVLMR